MASAATNSPRRPTPHPVVKSFVTAVKSRLFNRSARSSPHRIVSGSGNTILLGNGWKVLDASGGAAVSCIGRVNERVEKAMIKQMRLGLSYVSSMAFDTDVAEKLASFLTTSTNDEMSKVVFYSSGMSLCFAIIVPCSHVETGSEAVEAAFKLAIQYHAKEKMYPEPSRTQFIARDRSYHGATLGALALSGHRARKEVYQYVLPSNVSRIAPCNPYRDRRTDETDSQYIGRLQDGLRQKILELGPKNVAGFVVEPVVGAVSFTRPFTSPWISKNNGFLNVFHQKKLREPGAPFSLLGHQFTTTLY
jgi:adenosylmethionine-8-amino-7-oxononanoate aminotransferase